MPTNSRWIPLESNPKVLNSWSKAAGLLDSEAQFEDVYGLDAELLGMVSRPVKALVLLFPLTQALIERRAEEEATLAMEGRPAVNPTIIWIKQTIDNACGTMGVIHALANSGVAIVSDSPVAKFIAECKDKNPEERAHLLETTPLFANMHADVTASGQTSILDDLDTDLHFTCFIQALEVGNGAAETGVNKMRLIELDGDRAGPVDRGECEDLLLDVAKIVKEIYVAHSSSMHFSMMSLGPPT